MTQIPEVESVWVHISNGIKWAVVFADSISVLIEHDDGIRTTFDTEHFLERFKPAPRKVTHRRWVNLYADGAFVGPFHTRIDALSRAAEGIVETRLIEWTVEEGGGS